jgi:HNH endonuclease/AP2 domain
VLGLFQSTSQNKCTTVILTNTTNKTPISSNLTKELLHEYFEYRDGELFWKKEGKGIQTSKLAGCVDTNGYYKVKIQGKMHGLHRVIFAMHYGYFPSNIDHIDGDQSNNRIENLREATTAQNAWNTTSNSRNTSGYKNVLFRKSRGKWTCRFKVNGKHIMRGAFNTPEEASVYAEFLRKKFHGEFARS